MKECEMDNTTQLGHLDRRTMFWGLLTAVTLVFSAGEINAANRKGSRRVYIGGGKHKYVGGSRSRSKRSGSRKKR